MPEIDLFPVVCTAEVPTSVVDKLLSEAHAASERLVPGSDPCLALITTTETTTTDTTTPVTLPTNPSSPPIQPFTSPFLAQPLSAIAARLPPSVLFFAVLDARSAADAHTALVVAARETENDGGVPKAARVTFDSVQRLLTALDVATTGIDEVRDIAESQGGVYGAAAESAQKGGPAPPKRLGA